MRGRPKGRKNKPKCSEMNNVHVSCTDSKLVQYIGKLVSYYNEGYRAGYLDSLSKDGKTAKIRPIPAYRAAAPHRVSVDASTVVPA